MKIEEAIKIIEIAKAEIEWIAPLEYQGAFDTAICVLKAYGQAVKERDTAVEQLKELGYELGEEIRKEGEG